MRVASKTMVQATHWLWWTLPRTNVSDHHRFTLEMARGTSSQSCYFQWITVTTIGKLCQLFSTFGLPDKIVIDNGSVFTSGEFADSMSSNGISHVKVAAYHPSSNGLAERAVQIFKRNMERQTTGTVKTKLARFLFNYRTPPHSTTTTSPAHLLMGWKLKTCLDLLHPDLQKKVESSVQRQKYSHDQHARVRPSFKVGDKVYIRNFSDGGRWIKAIVIKILGPLSYLVIIANGIEVKRHIDHMWSQFVSSTTFIDDTYY